MALTINHQTNDISATSGSMTIDGSAVGGGGSLSTAAISGSSQTVDFTKDIVTSTVASKATTFAFSGASTVDKTTLIIDNNYSEAYAAGDTSFNSTAANDADFSDSNSHTLYSFAFSPNGSSVAFLAGNGEAIYHTLSTPFDLSTISASRGATIDMRASSYTANNGTMRSIQWANGGNDVFVLTGTGNKFVRLSVTSSNTFTGMSRIWTFTPTFSVGNQTQIYVPNSGVKYFFSDTSNKIIRTFTPSSAYGNSGSYTETFSPSWTPADLAFNPAGTKMVAMDSSKVLHMYTLSSAFDLSTLSFVGKGPDLDALISAAGTTATYVSVYKIAFNADGTKLIVTSNQNDQLLYDFNINGGVSFTFPSSAELPASLPAPPKNKKLSIDFVTTDGGTSYQVTGTAENLG